MGVRAGRRRMYATGEKQLSASRRAGESVAAREALPLSSAANEYRRDLVLVHSAEARIAFEQRRQGVARSQQHYSGVIQVGVAAIVRVAELGVMKARQQLVAIEVGAGIDADGILRQIPDEESAPVEDVPQRAWDGILLQEMHGVHRVHGGDGTLQSLLGESCGARQDEKQHRDRGENSGER